MKIKLIQIDPTDESWIIEGIEKYMKRIERYSKFEIQTLKVSKNIRQKTIPEQKSEEGKLLIKSISDMDYKILLDEKGRSFPSSGFANYLQNLQSYQRKNIVFIIGGPFGFSEEVYKIADDKIQLSEMTFSHQMIRVFFLEQIYRAFTIQKGEKYHHE